MKINYTITYLKIYFWQMISIFLGLASMFIVIPFLTENKTTYGVYSIVISLNIFYTYANVGFLNAGQKYAAEYFAMGDLENEIRTISFASFIYLLFISIISLIIVVFAINPQYLITGIDGENLIIARKLLGILAFSSPIVVIQRTIQVVFAVRIKDYVYQQFSIFGSLVKILSVFYFFGSGQGNIVLYFLFIQITNLGVVLISILYMHLKIEFSLNLFIKHFKFSTIPYNHIKKLAFTSFVLTLSWVAYYESDLIVIGKLFGAEDVAVYSLALSILALFRTFFGILYTPFTSRFNHFKGNNDIEGLKSFFMHVVKLTFPIVVIPILVVSILSKSFILSWVGTQYFASIEVVSTLILCNMLAFISYPAGILFNTLERIQILFISALLIPIVYWIGIIVTCDHLGLMSFAIFKIVSFVIGASFYFIYALKELNIKAHQFLKSVILPYILPMIIAVLLALIAKDIAPSVYSKKSLIYNIVIIGLITVIGLSLSLLTSKYLRKYMYTAMKLVLNVKR